MKQRIAVVLLLAVLCNASAVILLVVDAPQDEPAARAWARSRPELKPLHTAYTNLIQTRLWPLKFSEMAEIFGPKIETASNWWRLGTNGVSEHSGPDLARRPADLVLPMFAPGGGTNCGG